MLCRSVTNAGDWTAGTTCWSDANAGHGGNAAGTSQHAADDAAALQMMPACRARTVAGAPADASTATATATVSAAHVDGTAASTVAGIVSGPAAAAALSRLKETWPRLNQRRPINKMNNKNNSNRNRNIYINKIDS